jgi:transposase-like protein
VAAEDELKRLVTGYRDKAERLAVWLERNVPEGLTVFEFPEHTRRRLRTANPIVRSIQQEVKRRTVKVRVFPSRQALLRLVTANFVEIDEEWAASPCTYINWQHPDDGTRSTQISRRHVA